MPTSVETPNSAATDRVAAEKMDEPNAAVRVTKPRTTAMRSFLASGQFYVLLASTLR